MFEIQIQTLTYNMQIFLPTELSSQGSLLKFNSIDRVDIHALSRQITSHMQNIRFAIFFLVLNVFFFFVKIDLKCIVIDYINPI